MGVFFCSELNQDINQILDYYYKMNLGFIGTGKIASSVIKGICTSSIKYNKIYISSRNNLIAKRLKKRFKRIFIEKDNQKIIDKSNWIFLSVTPEVG